MSGYIQEPDAGGPFGCTEDIPGCCAACLCPLCMIGLNRMNNDDPDNCILCCAYMCGTYCCYPFASCIICQGYQSTKRKSRVKTEDVNDYCMSLCCPICVIAQEARMIKGRHTVHPNTQAPPQVQVMVNTPAPVVHIQQPQQQMMMQPPQQQMMMQPQQQMMMQPQPMMGQPQPMMMQPAPAYSEPIMTGVPVAHVKSF